MFFFFTGYGTLYSQVDGFNCITNINEHSFSKIELEKFVLNDSLKKNLDKFEMKKSPLKAVLLSAVIPGLGQFYNEAYWKVPVIALLGGYFGYEIFRNNNKFGDYRDLYAESQTPENPNGDDRYRQYREFYRNQRDQFYFYFGIFYLINLVDAYVDAHLFDFNVSDKIKLTLDKKSALNLSFNF